MLRFKHMSYSESCLLMGSGKKPTLREMLTARLQCGHLNIVCSALHIQSTSEIGILKKENISYQGGKAVSFL